MLINCFSFRRRSGEIQRQLEADGELDCDVNDLLSESDDEVRSPELYQLFERRLVYFY